jgi:hypothetical protein
LLAFAAAMLLLAISDRISGVPDKRG